MATNSIKLLTGNSHPALAKLVADRLGIELAKILVVQYSNQETSVTIGESVRDEDGRPLTVPFAQRSNPRQSSSSSPPLPARSTTASWSCSS
jgi:phosphoribosylpyrophosphate synthetase